MMEIAALTFCFSILGYLIGCLIWVIIASHLDYHSPYKNDKFIFSYPIVPFLLLCDLIKYLHLKNKSKSMNFKILGKAMSFLFLPTLGVLLLLLVGFWDPIALWNFIKSNSGGAIFVRVLLFIIETGLVITMYFYYLDKDEREQALNDDVGSKKAEKRRIHKSNYIENAYPDTSSGKSYDFWVYPTSSQDIIMIERTKQ